MKKILTFLTLIVIFINTPGFASMYEPTLTTPTDGATNQTPYLFLNWTAVPGAFSYKIEIDTNSGFSNPIKYTVTMTAEYISNLLFSTTYYWRVKAIGISDSSDWTSAWSFTTISTTTITAPLNNSTGRYVKMPISWSAIAGATYYDWEVDSASTFDSPLYRQGSVSSSYTSTYTSQLFFGQSYYLRVRARHAYDTSAWSATVFVTTLDSFGLRRPNDNYDTLQMINTTFKWDYAGAKYYHVGIATDSALTSPEIIFADSSDITAETTDTCMYAPASELYFGTVYYWSVRAFNIFDTTAWMPIRSIKTIDSVTIKTPANNSTSVSTLTSFTWAELEGIQNYVLQYDTSATFSNPTEENISSGTLTFTPDDELLTYTTYYWRMKAQSSIDETNWNNAWSFTTGSGYGKDELTLNKYSVSLFPNPCKGKLNININSQNIGNIYIELSNILGQVLINKTIKVTTGNNDIQIEMDNLSNGIYLIKVQNTTSTYTRKIILDK